MAKDERNPTTPTASHADGATDTYELLTALKDLARAEVARNPKGHASRQWQALRAVLDRMVPDVAPPPAADPTPRARDR